MGHVIFSNVFIFITVDEIEWSFKRYMYLLSMITIHGTTTTQNFLLMARLKIILSTLFYLQLFNANKKNLYINKIVCFTYLIIDIKKIIL